MNPSPAPARYIMIGGFLGSGKTTSILRLARWLSSRGETVGLIDNDQGSRLVDTALLSSHGFQVEEISGGCFCCRFNSLVEAADRLTQGSHPTVFVAEPVGSCTDLVATVTYPLRRMYGDRYTIAPLSVLVDPLRALRVLGLEPGGRFSSKVEYIYRKQLEEADIIVINKRDLLTPPALASLEKSLAREYPHATIHSLSSRDGAGLEPWFEQLVQHTQIARTVMDVDYDVYAEGEALLGWLNASYALRTTGAGIDANQLLRSLSEAMRQRLVADGAEIAHFKMTIEPDGGLGELAAIQLVRNDYVPELSAEIDEPVQSGRLTVNLRAEADPAALQAHLRASIPLMLSDFPDLRLAEEHLESFRPGKPQPTHRMTV